MGLIMDRKRVMALVLSAGVLSLAACGVKSSPEYPGGVYLRQYPAPGPQSQTSAPAPAPSTGQTKETEDGARSPLGFPLEYPNRPTYN
jgi:hypothetical protein